MRNITKVFPGVKALDDVSFDLIAGEVHVLMGENGAGKSTLMKILSGSYHQDEGEISIDGEIVHFKSPIHALQHGVAMIYQELNPVPHMSIAENVFMGKEPKLFKLGLVDYKKMRSETAKLLDVFGMSYLNPKSLMSTLSVAETQMIEIIKAYSCDAKILIMDEPTSAITDHEVDKLFEITNMLKAKKVGIVYISHKMEELWRFGDRITVLRDGKYIDTKKVSDVDVDAVIRMMVGRDITQQFPKEEVELGEELLSVDNLSDVDGRFRNVNFELRRGEILGMAGLMGAGRTEVVETLFGIRKRKTGTIRIKGNEVVIKRPKDAMQNGFALVGEDRKGTGLNLKDSIRFNISICTLKAISQMGVVNGAKENVEVDRYIEKLRIKTPSREQKTIFLSGGNQQKVVVAKWLMTEPEIFILDEPTRGIDVGAKAEIHQIITELAKQGKGIIMVSSELPEVLGMSDRVLVMHEGNVSGILSKEEMDQEKIMHLATGEKEVVSQ